ncbi:hypothetical protein C2G38_2171424 [Gigaspora rosea]|uniref:F-box domain-containing protein n=1 Tax=Gigaspora rosea TaxID=44941 RepID=A0A397VWK1_9GLOM|nr:hypothetical protein C2G38_2171424 [Gigaspora rosea]
MASKIFMGNMLELMEKILNNLDKEIRSLYSCALVSRHWCEMSIPIIWRNPFSLYIVKPTFISIYISSFEDLEDDVKSILKEYGININFQNPLFPYVRFLEILSLDSLNSSETLSETRNLNRNPKPRPKPETSTETLKLPKHQ